MKPRTLRFTAEGMHRPAQVVLGWVPVHLAVGPCFYLGVGSEDIFLTVEQATALAKTLIHNIDCMNTKLASQG